MARNKVATATAMFVTDAVEMPITADKCARRVDRPSRLQPHLRVRQLFQLALVVEWHAMSDAVDELFAVEPAQFVRARDDLVRRLRSEGHRDEAEEIRRL